jgi:hypothetical protein
MYDAIVALCIYVERDFVDCSGPDFRLDYRYQYVGS